MIQTEEVGKWKAYFGDRIARPAAEGREDAEKRNQGSFPGLGWTPGWMVVESADMRNKWRERGAVKCPAWGMLTERLSVSK